MARARTTLVVDLALTAALMLLTALVLVTLCRDECYQTEANTPPRTRRVRTHRPGILNKTRTVAPIHQLSRHNQLREESAQPIV